MRDMIQRPAPRQPVRPKRRYTLALPLIHPMVRIAHRCEGGLRIRPRIIFDHELVFLVRGRGVFYRENVTEPIVAGELLLIRPFERHGFDLDGPSEHIAVHFDLAPDVPDPGAGDRDRATYAVQLGDGLAWPARLRLGGDDPIATWLTQVVDLAGNDDVVGRAESGVRLLQVLLAMLRRTAPPRDPRFDQLVGFVSDHLHAPIGADDLADAADLSASQCRRLLLQWTGLSPMAFVRRARVDRARRLLADPHTRLSIKQIAYRCGFRDPYHFSRVFRRVDGLSPTQFRQAARP